MLRGVHSSKGKTINSIVKAIMPMGAECEWAFIIHSTEGMEEKSEGAIIYWEMGLGGKKHWSSETNTSDYSSK